MPKLVIDNREIEVPQGTKVIEAAERLGIMIPRFCYHPALGPVGACRVCAVKFVDGPVKGTQMSCMTEARDGMVVSTTDPEAVEFRRQVIEWLMMNHPHDCPVCDEGGECLLQDMTVSGGHGIRRYPGKKRTYRDQYLGVFVHHEMNRCIHCYRCWRFYQGFAGYRDLGVVQIAYRTYFGRFKEGPLESPFSGNLNDICPVGVYTDKPSRFVGRRWDFQRSPSLCIHCSLGCNTVGNARYRAMVRQEARFNAAVNGWFICDRGRYGFFYESLAERPRKPRLGGKEVSREEAMLAAADALPRIQQSSGPGAVACLGSARSSLENQAMLKRFSQLRGFGEPQFFPTASMARKVQKAAARMQEECAVSLREIEGADLVLVVGADPLQEAPMLAMAMRQAFRNIAEIAPMFPLPAHPRVNTAPVLVLDPRPVSLPMEYAHLPVPPGELDVILRQLIRISIDRKKAIAQGPEALRFYDALPENTLSGEIGRCLEEMGGKIRQSKKPVIICGTEIVRESTIDLAADFALLLKAEKGRGGLFYLLPGPNAWGAALLSPAAGSLEEIVAGIEEGKIKAVVAVESDPFWAFPDRARLETALGRLDLLLVLDYLPSRTAALAHILFPTAPLFETEARFINQEGRVQCATPVHRGGMPILYTGGGNHPPRVYAEGPGGESKPAWEILAQLAGMPLAAQAKAEVLLPRSLEDLWRWLTSAVTSFSGAPLSAVPPQGFRVYAEEKGQPFLPQEGPPEEQRDAFELLLTDWTFGTEELAAYSGFVQQVEKKPLLFMQTRDAEGLGFRDGDQVRLALEAGDLEVSLSVAEKMARGVIVLPRHRQLEWQKIKRFPAWVEREKITKI